MRAYDDEYVWGAADRMLEGRGGDCICETGGDLRCGHHRLPRYLDDWQASFMAYWCTKRGLHVEDSYDLAAEAWCYADERTGSDRAAEQVEPTAESMIRRFERQDCTCVGGQSQVYRTCDYHLLLAVPGGRAEAVAFAEHVGHWRTSGQDPTSGQGSVRDAFSFGIGRGR